MKKILEIALGIVTSIGGFLDVGAIATSAEAGAAFGFQLIWASLLGTLCVIFLVEMSGRLAAVSKHTLSDSIREHFGFRFHAILLLAEIAIDFLVLAAEIGGVCIALQLVSGISFQWWALPVAIAIWLLLWKGTFGLIDKAWHWAVANPAFSGYSTLFVHCRQYPRCGDQSLSVLFLLIGCEGRRVG